MRLPALLLISIVPLAAACLVVQGDRVTAGDLASSLPAFGTLAASTPVAYAPQPAVTRTLTIAELRRLAARLQISAGGLHEVCLERATRRLTTEEIAAALRATPGLKGAQIEIVDFLRAPLPPGKLELARAGLVLPPASDPARPIVWRGRIRYSPARTASFWVRFRARVKRQQVVAAATIPAGEPIDAQKLRLIETEVSPFAPVACETIECAAGKIARRSLHPNDAIRRELVRAAPVIARGDMVTVEAAVGEAAVTITARADGSGVTGSRITLVNPDSGKRFQAIVTGSRRARLDYGKEIKNAASKQSHTGPPPAGSAAAGGAATGGWKEAETAHSLADRPVSE